MVTSPGGTKSIADQSHIFNLDRGFVGASSRVTDIHSGSSQSGAVRSIDPRWFQIAVLGSLLLYGLFILRFDLHLLQVGVVLSTVLLTQLLCTMAFAHDASARHDTGGQRTFEARSALISGLSLCLLLRSNDLRLIALTAVITILSKFTIRHRGKHLFNPTNFGIALAVALTGDAWVSPGQWGSGAVGAALILLAGMTVVTAAARSDVTWSFILAYGGLLLFRALRLGDPLEIPLHQLASGAFVIFAFFMISDPRSTPDSRAGRIFFATLVAAAAYVFRFWYFSPNGLIYSLALVSPLTPVIDWLLPGDRFRWDAPRGKGEKSYSEPLVPAALQPATA